MMKLMGIKINFEEAKILIATADKDKTGDLNMKEFMDLIFVDNQALENEQINNNKLTIDLKDKSHYKKIVNYLFLMIQIIIIIRRII